MIPRVVRVSVGRSRHHILICLLRYPRSSMGPPRSSGCGNLSDFLQNDANEPDKVKTPSSHYLARRGNWLYVITQSFTIQCVLLHHKRPTNFGYFIQFSERTFNDSELGYKLASNALEQQTKQTVKGHLYPNCVRNERWILNEGIDP